MDAEALRAGALGLSLKKHAMSPAEPWSRAGTSAHPLDRAAVEAGSIKTLSIPVRTIHSCTLISACN